MLSISSWPITQKRWYLMLCIALGFVSLVLFDSNAWALKADLLPKTFQTTNEALTPRTLALKLPIQGIEYHWIFTDPKVLLSGKLILSITHSNGKIDNIIIFNNGKLDPNWTTLQVPAQIKGMYFEFVSKNQYLTAPNDKLDLALIVKKPLAGVGPCIRGTLQPGTYTSSGIYSGLTDNPDLSKTKIGQFAAKMSPKARQQLLQMLNNRAFLQTWYQQWPLQDVTNQGWLAGNNRASYCNATPDQ